MASFSPNPWNFELKTKDTGFDRKARNALGQFQSLWPQAEKVNKRSVEWLVDRAAVNLAESYVRPRTRNSGRLLAALRDPDSHSANLDGFRFMIDEKMRAKAPYYRAIEHGSNASVGRRLPLRFFDFAGGEQVAANFDRYPTDVAPRVGGSPRQQNPRFVIVRTPIEAHNYGTHAVDKFIADSVYERYLNEVLDAFSAKSGISVKRRR